MPASCSLVTRAHRTVSECERGARARAFHLRVCACPPSVRPTADRALLCRVADGRLVIYRVCLFVNKQQQTGTGCVRRLTSASVCAALRLPTTARRDAKRCPTKEYHRAAHHHVCATSQPRYRWRDVNKQQQTTQHNNETRAQRSTFHASIALNARLQTITSRPTHDQHRLIRTCASDI